MNLRRTIHSIGSVAYKEFLHIWRDWRIMVLVLALPPLLTIIFGHAFEVATLSGVPALLHDTDASPESARLIRLLSGRPTFSWREAGPIEATPSLVREGVDAA